METVNETKAKLIGELVQEILKMNTLEIMGLKHVTNDMLSAKISKSESSTKRRPANE